MDGIHDLGGKYGFGAVETQAEGPVFHERWQGAVFTMVNALFASGIAHNTDYFRHAVERIDPVNYLADGYYGRWLGAVETMLVEAGKLTQQEITERVVARGGHETRVAARPRDIPEKFEQNADPDIAGQTAQRPALAKPEFSLGQRVRTAHGPVPGHTRLPAYARGVVGEVIACHGSWVYPDSNAHGGGEQPQQLYTVVFTSRALWGEAGDANLEVCLDLFEPYLYEEA